MSRTWTRLWLMVVLISWSGLGCSTDGGGEDPAGSESRVNRDESPDSGSDNRGDGELEHASGTVGSAGGTVETASGARVTIPSGALDEPTAVTLSELSFDELAPLPDGVQALGLPVALTPHGTQFGADVQVRLPLPADADPDALNIMRLDDETDSEWEDLGSATKDGDSALFSVRGFSVFLIVLGSNGSDTSADACRQFCKRQDDRCGGNVNNECIMACAKQTVDNCADEYNAGFICAQAMPDDSLECDGGWLKTRNKDFCAQETQALRSCLDEVESQ